MLPPSEQWWERWTRDERILGGSDFVAAVIEQTHPRPAKVAAAVVMPFLLRAVAARCQVTPEEIASSSVRWRALAARAVVCQFAVRHRGLSLRAIAGALGISKNNPS
jgi:chromosomal replication initiation ATPase DnaA